MNPPTYMSPPTGLAPPGQQAVPTKSPFSGLSINGVMLFTIGLLVVASGYMALRPQIMGLALHLALVPIGLSFPFVLLSRVGLLPVRILTSLTVFVAIYSFSIFNGADIAISEIFKIFASFITIITCALLVRKRGDFVAGIVGLSIGVALLAVPGLSDNSAAGIDLMEGANRNSYSLYALPSMLVAGFICTRWKSVPVFFKGIMALCILIQLAAIFMSANRSGYLGAALAGLMLFWDQRGKGLLLVGAMTLSLALIMINLGRTEVFDRRLTQTVEGNESDNLRVAILFACMEITLENPLIGVSPQHLHETIARKVDAVNWGQLDSHNVFGHVAAASGLICFAAMFAIGWALWTFAPGIGKLPKDDPLYASRKLLRMLVVLWVVRGLFTREVLYNPAFCMAIGFTIGLCIIAQTERQRTAVRSPYPMSDPRLGAPGIAP